jgi:ankyrin repeat protein
MHRVHRALDEALGDADGPIETPGGDRGLLLQRCEFDVDRRQGLGDPVMKLAADPLSFLLLSEQDFMGETTSPPSFGNTLESPPSRAYASRQRSRQGRPTRTARRPIINRFARGSLIAGFVIGVVCWGRFAEAKPNLGKKLLGAAMYGETTKVLELLGQGADPNYADKQGCTPLIVAAGGCGEAMDINAKGETTIRPVVSGGTVEMVHALLEHGADPNAVNRFGHTALQFAAKYGRTESVRALIGAPAEVSVRDTSGQNALMWASIGGHVEVVRLLLEASAAVDAADSEHVTALQFAANNGHMEVVRDLIGAGANPNAKDRLGQTVLMAAAKGGYSEIVIHLLAHGAAIDAIDSEYGETALAAAAFNGQPATVKVLLEKGASVNPRNKEGRTPLSVARERGHQEVVKLLEAAGGKD